MSNFNDFIKPIDSSLAPKNRNRRNQKDDGDSYVDIESYLINAFELFVVAFFVFLLFCALILHFLKPYYILEDGQFKPYEESRKHQLEVDYEVYRQEGIQKSAEKVRKLREKRESTTK